MRVVLIYLALALSHTIVFALGSWLGWEDGRDDGIEAGFLRGIEYERDRVHAMQLRLDPRHPSFHPRRNGQ